MSPIRGVVGIIAIVAGAIGCQRDRDVVEAQAAALATREQRLAALLADTAVSASIPDAPLARWVLPLELREISGIAVTPEGNLLAHNDEQARVYVIDPRRGVVIKQFNVGSGMRADFEGIAVSGADIYLLISNGKILRFREGRDRDEVQPTEIDTRLGAECEFEGIAVDPSTGMLVLPCKSVAKKLPRGQLVLFRWDPRKGPSQEAVMLTIPMPRVAAGNPWRSLHTSDMTIDPATGNYVLIAAQEKAIVEITPGGNLVRAGLLPEPSQQAEGVAITKEGVLIVADEGNDRAATLTLYRWPLAIEPAGSVPPPTTTR